MFCVMTGSLYHCCSAILKAIVPVSVVSGRVGVCVGGGDGVLGSGGAMTAPVGVCSVGRKSMM